MARRIGLALYGCQDPRNSSINHCESFVGLCSQTNQKGQTQREKWGQSRRFSQIFAFARDNNIWEVQMSAENAGDCRNLPKPVCPIKLSHFNSSRVAFIAGTKRCKRTSPPWRRATLLNPQYLVIACENIFLKNIVIHASEDVTQICQLSLQRQASITKHNL